MRASALSIIALLLAGQAQAQTHFRHQGPDPFAKEKAMAVMFGDTQYAGKACPGLEVDGSAVTKTLYANGLESMDLENEAPEEIWLAQQKRRAKQGAGVACPAILEAYGPQGSLYPGLVSTKR